MREFREDKIYYDFMVVSSDDKYVITSNRKYVKKWDIKTGELLRQLYSHNSMI